MSNSREWNAAAYHRLSAPQFEWGQRVLGELHLRGDECVLDAGCGTGKLTRHCCRIFRAAASLASTFPATWCGTRGRICVLISATMRSSSPPTSSRCHFATASTASSAPRHFTGSSIMTRSSAIFLERCAPAAGCTRSAEEAPISNACASACAFCRSRWSSRAGLASPEPWFYADADGARSFLHSAGFTDVETGLEPASFAVASAEEFQDYLRHLVLAPSSRTSRRTSRWAKGSCKNLAAVASRDDPP